MDVPVDLFSAGPVFLTDMSALLPLTVVDVLLVMVLVVVMVLGEGDSSGQCEGECRYSDSSVNCSHALTPAEYDSEGQMGVVRRV
jgi:hypothetical protein